MKLFKLLMIGEIVVDGRSVDYDTIVHVQADTRTRAAEIGHDQAAQQSRVFSPNQEQYIGHDYQVLSTKLV